MTRARCRRMLMLSATCLAFTAPLAQAYAQSPATDAPILEEIIVTAERRAASVQDTPIAIAAFNADKLAELGINTTDSLARQTPSFTVRRDATNASLPLFTIRGLGQNQSYLSLQPSTAIYIDGVYSATSTGAIFAGGMFDVSRVEVLKGPQGTLFGRNSTGGAVNVSTGLPEDELKGVAEIAYGRFDRREASAMVNVPLDGGNAGLRLVGQYIKSDGYGHDLTSGEKLNYEDLQAVRGSFRAAGDKFEMVVRADYTNSNPGEVTRKLGTVATNANNGIRAAAMQLGLVTSAADPRFTNPAFVASVRQAILDASPSGKYDVRFRPGSAPDNTNETYGGSITASYFMTENVEVKWIGAYRENFSKTIQDADGTPFILLAAIPGFSQKSEVWTQELQVNGSAMDDRLRFATGLYYYDLEGYDKVETETLGVLNATSPSRYYAGIKDISKSPYGQVSYDLIDGLTVTGGLRYTDEEITFHNRNRISTNGAPGACVVPVADQQPGECLAIYETNFTNWSYTGALDYKPSEDLLLYGRVSRGFKAGGRNQNAQVDPALFSAFRPEIATTYELGVKSELLDRRMRVNAAGFWTDFKDIQRTAYAQIASGAVASRVENAASATIKGLEADVTVLPTANIDVSLGGAYTKTHYDEYTVINPVTRLPEDRSDDPFPGVPRWQGNAAIGYTLPVGFGDVRFGADASYQSKVNYDPANSSALSNDVAVQGGYTLVNGRIAFTFDEYDAVLTATVTNIFNKNYIISSTDLTTSLGFGNQVLGAPRTWGLRLRKNF